MTLTVLQNSGIIERPEELWDFYAERPAVDQDKQIPSLTEITEREASVLRGRLWEAITLLKASREALDVFASAAAIMHRYRPHAPDDEVFRSGVAWTKDGEARMILMADFRRAADVHARIGKA